MKKTNLIRVLALALCLVILAGCAAGTQTTAETTQTAEGESIRDTLRINNGASAVSPFESDTTANGKLLLLTHDRLLEKNLAEEKPNEMIPGLATEWNWVEETVLELKLRDDVTFHNGEPFTSDDVVFTFGKAKEGVSASKLELLQTVQAIDDYTVRFTLSDFNVDFTFLLSETFCSICNREACEADDVSGTWIGTGAYVVTEFVQSDHCFLDRNENYWGEPGASAHIQCLTFPEIATALMALENDETDACGFDVVDIHYIEDNPELVANFRPGMLVYMAFNTTRGPGSDKNFRLAVAHAINTDDMLAVCDPGYSTAQGSFWGTSTLGLDSSIEPHEHNIELAKEYLAKSNYNEFTITTTPSTEFIAEVVQANCAQAGIKVNIESIELAALTKKCTFSDPEHEATIGTTTWNTFGDDCRRFYYPGSNLNRAILTNDRIIELIDKASKETDTAVREEYYHEVQQINYDDAYYLTLCVGAETIAFKANMKGVLFDPRGRNDFTYAYIAE